MNNELYNKKIQKPLPSSFYIDEYMNHIYESCEKNMPTSSKKVDKITNDELCIPTIENIAVLFNNNYNVQQLKLFAKHYKLKVSGNKRELVCRIYNYLTLSNIAIKIQKIFRGFLQKKCNQLHGPAFFNRSLCTNDSDFLTGDSMISLHHSQFFSYQDADNFIYGFDIISLYNLIKKSDKTVKNPYNRNQISKQVIKTLRTLIRISRILKIDIDIDIQETVVSYEKTLELKILDIFQHINALGNYSEPVWFTSLSRNQMIKFMRELIDIWSYRAQLSNEVKRNICPPNGDPFRNINFAYLHNEESIDNIKKSILVVLEKMVNTGVNNDSKTLGAYYVLSALTLVNDAAATALPWLFHSVSHA
uniref:SAP domain-containing protein n=1 Tax=viral metagenome TaxID=1070528 RepID=A0A6C0B1D9_9ZZZZ